MIHSLAFNCPRLANRIIYKTALPKFLRSKIKRIKYIAAEM